ncbi:unnamed protein product, partial [Prorocentrum cordatum]
PLSQRPLTATPAGHAPLPGARPRAAAPGGRPGPGRRPCRRPRGPAEQGRGAVPLPGALRHLPRRRPHRRHPGGRHDDPQGRRAELFKANDLQSLHQTVRWISTKEEHATKIMTTISEYFLAQKVKKDQLGHHEYLEVLALHHAVMVAAMKAKQSADMSAVDALDKAIAALKPVYAK